MTAYDALGGAAGDDLASICLQALESRGQTLGTAESLTAGLVAATLATVPGASTVLRGGLAAYATDVKIDVLGVDAAVIARHGVYSAACAEQMADRVRTFLTCDWGLSTTGVAGPASEGGHPAGDVQVAVAGPGGVLVSEGLMLTGGRQEVRGACVRAALTLLRDQLG